jgi:hypothetical protein
MTKMFAFVSAIALAASLGAAGANAAPVHKHAAQLASKAQLDREHARAMKAGDTANDPYDSSSSDSLNQQQLAKAQALPGAEVQPGAISSTNTSGVDANTGQTSTGMSNDTSGQAPMNPSTPDAMPPQSPPVQGTTPGSQNTPQATPSTPQGTTSDTTPPQ